MSNALAVTKFPPCHHAADRWATMVRALLLSDRDQKSITSWGRFAGVSAPLLRAWCKQAGVRPKSSLDFARVLRVVAHSQTSGPTDFYNLLDVSDRRTLERLLRRGSLQHWLEQGQAPSLDAFLAQQTFVRDARLVDLLRTKLRR
jgi:hypothetical protein